ncbi:MAG: Holliday junction branch migration protein RuvA [Coxiella-like endosymbiont]|uniref:Holliday junction branch migration protein RuvA n=1 Tax=Coxiella-like endosymbiont TaxID=1592897 RepID=UPI00215A4CD8|nr:Holliday junction branch migration protein RuvA [Coxiella-like endosymbiont]UVE59394.1 Holliday junction branch migration protein RuvA [Coxiella-like endosymbiont]
MIGRLRGIVLEKQPPYLLLEVAGVSYEIAAPVSTFHYLADTSEEVILYTHLVIREDAHILYGFHGECDRRLFRALIKVSGVGPRSALTILSAIGHDEFVQCILHQNVDQLVSIPGIGRKTAERLIVETKDALMRWQTNAFTSKGNGAPINQPTQDAIRALIALGYKPKEAKRAVDAVRQPPLLTIEALIRLALKQVIT